MITQNVMMYQNVWIMKSKWVKKNFQNGLKIHQSVGKIIATNVNNTFIVQKTNLRALLGVCHCNAESKLRVVLKQAGDRSDCHTGGGGKSVGP